MLPSRCPSTPPSTLGYRRMSPSIRHRLYKQPIDCIFTLRCPSNRRQSECRPFPGGSLPRESNPTLRVVRILDFLASRPDESFGLSEMARILQMNKATCLTILGGLVETGYLLQDPESKSYSLGPSSIALGHAAAARLPALDPALGVMHDLRDELGLECVAMVKAANHLVLLGPQGPRGLLTPITGRPGFRAPFVPPMGATLMAFAPPSELE